MAYPQQTFPTLAQAVAYANTVIVTNGRKEIDAIEANNLFNALAEYIVKYTVNSYASGAAVISTGGDVTLSKPVNIITLVTPDSLTWPVNIQKEYYITNTLSVPIPLDGVSYYDFSLAQQTEIPILSTIHIAQATNGSWIQVNNLGGISSDVANSKEDTPTVTIDLSGTLNRTIEANVNISETAGNIITVDYDGLYAPPTDPISNEAENTETITINLSGTFDRVISADVNVSDTAGNQLTVDYNGLYVPLPDIPEGAVTGDI